MSVFHPFWSLHSVRRAVSDESKKVLASENGDIANERRHQCPRDYRGDKPAWIARPSHNDVVVLCWEFCLPGEQCVQDLARA